MPELSDAEVFAAPAPGHVAVGPLPSLPGYVSDPTYTPPQGQTSNPTWQAPQVPLGGAGHEMSDDQVFGGAQPADHRPTSQTLGFGEGLTTVGGNLLHVMRDLPGYGQATGLPAFLQNGVDAMQTARDVAALPASLIMSHLRNSNTEAEKTTRPGETGRTLGKFVGTVPFGGAIPVVSGAAQGFLGSDAPTDIGKAEDAGIGAVGGQIGGAVLAGAQRVISPALRPVAQWAAEHGIRATPGALMGGAAQKVENGLTKLAFLGPLVRNSQIRSIEDFNTATLNGALKPAGLAMPEGVSAGHEAIDAAHKTLSGAYNDLLPKLTVVQDAPIEVPAAADLSDTYRAKFDKLLKTQVLPKFSTEGGVPAMTGENMKSLDSLLGAQARRFGKAQDPLANEYGDAVSDLRGHLRDMTERSNPEHADQLGAINSGWAQLVRAEKAGTLAAQRGGVFTPSDLISAARSTDSSARSSATARGHALLQDWANTAKGVIPDKMPAGGSWMDHALEGIVTLGVGKEAGMPIVAKAAALEGLLGLAYTKPGQKVVTAALTQRPAWAPRAAELAEKLRPLLVGAGALAPQLPGVQSTMASSGLPR